MDRERTAVRELNVDFVAVQERRAKEGLAAGRQDLDVARCAVPDDGGRVDLEPDDTPVRKDGAKVVSKG